MPDDYRDESNQTNPHPQHDQPEDDPNGDTPASVIFMEMMRQAAAKNQPPGSSPSLPFDTPRQTAEKPLAQTPLASPAGVSAADDANRQRQAAIDSQRIRRVQRRKARRRTRTVGVAGGLIGALLAVVVSAGLMATIFSFWTDPQYFRDDVRSELQVALATSQVTAQPTGLPTPNWLRRIGVVSGHRGPENDPGAVCPDGLQERDVNFNIAQLVVRNLRGLGYSVDLLDEFDPRLNNYQAAALVSIHSNTCQEWPGGEIVTGYLVAKAASRPEGGEDTRLAECIALNYGPASGLERDFNLTEDMTNYHSFREIHPLTPAAIIELGFLLADRPALTEKPDQLARSITDGILCFLEPGNLPAAVTPPG